MTSLLLCLASSLDVSLASRSSVTQKAEPHTPSSRPSGGSHGSGGGARAHADATNAALGATSGDAFVEVQRTDLVGTVIGATALATREKIDEAKGGVLFLDEAYRLTATGSHKDYGREALEELMRDMLSGDPVIVAAGYRAEMQRFLAANEGMESRFGFVFTFDDYSPLELAQIFCKKVRAPLPPSTSEPPLVTVTGDNPPCDRYRRAPAAFSSARP